jgi:flagellar hook-basal body complex protein FliE
MADPFQIHGLRPGGIQPTGAPGASKGAAAVEGKDFQSFLVESLNKVDALSKDAQQAIEQLATGQTQNVAEVFTTVQKADVAFDLLMEIRNKLVESYQELKRMQV